MPLFPHHKLVVTVSLTVLLALCSLGCGPTVAGEAAWPPLGKKWYERAQQSYRTGDIEDAEYAAEHALKVVPNRPEVRELAAQVALAQLEYDRALQLTRGLKSDEVRGIRGRAYWYGGKIEQAANELDQALANPDFKDPWAKEVAKLARLGRGRQPFEMSGGLVGVAEMPRVGSPALIVPLEVDGEPALGMIATDVAEAVIDSSSGKGASWVSVRFGERIEVSDVPALARDLTRVSRQVNAPVKMLIGMNLLRHLHPTFDFGGSQFVVRSFEPPPPTGETSVVTTIPVNYVRGGGMLVRGAFSVEENAPLASFLVNTSMTYPLALDSGGWKKAGIALDQLSSVPNAGALKQGMLPMLRLGAFEVPDVPGVFGAPVEEMEKSIGMDLDGLVGSGLLAAFRVTLVDRGRKMWLEDLPGQAVGPAAAPGEPAMEPEQDVAAPPTGATQNDGKPALSPPTVTPPKVP
jgi:hypothetical protein